ncbi:MAG: hypothetical protein ACLT16_10530 [[Clostridium] innocuum]
MSDAWLINFTNPSGMVTGLLEAQWLGALYRSMQCSSDCHAEE